MYTLPSSLGKWLNNIISVIILAVVLAPVAGLVHDLIGAIVAGEELTFSLRHWRLLFNSVMYAAASAWVAVMIGMLVATYLWDAKKISAQIIKFILVIMLPMPGFIHTAGWRAVWQAASDRFDMLVSGQGWGAAVLITAMAYLPVAAGACWLGMHTVDREIVRMGRVYQSDLKVWQEIVMPLAMPYMAAGGIIIFLLSLLDYTIPSLCQVNVYALEIYSVFAAGGSPGKAFFISLPMIAAVSLAAGGLAANLRSMNLTGSKTKETGDIRQWPVWFKGLLGLGIFAVLAQAGIPFLSLIPRAVGGDLLWLQTGSVGEIVYSLLTAVVAALIAAVMAYPVARKLAQERAGWLWILVMLPIVMPAPLVGIGLIKVANLVSVLYGSSFMPVTAGIVRFMPLATLVIWAGFKRMDQRLLEAGLVMQAKPGQAFFRVEIPLMSPVMISAFVLLIVLVLGELGATLMVVPPGHTTLTITIYNYLHYGASGSVAALCLITAVLTCMLWGAGLLAVTGLSRRMRWEGQNYAES